MGLRMISPRANLGLINRRCTDGYINDRYCLISVTSAHCDE
jgi:hypothetical protein